MPVVHRDSLAVGCRVTHAGVDRVRSKKSELHRRIDQFAAGTPGHDDILDLAP